MLLNRPLMPESLDGAMGLKEVGRQDEAAAPFHRDDRSRACKQPLDKTQLKRWVADHRCYAGGQLDRTEVASDHLAPCCAGGLDRQIGVDLNSERGYVSRDGSQESPSSTRWFKYEVAGGEIGKELLNQRFCGQAGVKNWFNSDLDGWTA